MWKIRARSVIKMFLRRKLDVCALSETKLKRKGEVMFGEVVGRKSGVGGRRAREGMALLLSNWLLSCVVEWKEVSSRLMWVTVKIEREIWVFISAYGPIEEQLDSLECQEEMKVENDYWRCWQSKS